MCVLESLIDKHPIFFLHDQSDGLNNNNNISCDRCVKGTASDDIAAAIETYKKGHPYKCDKDGIIDIGVGKVE